MVDNWFVVIERYSVPFLSDKLFVWATHRRHSYILGLKRASFSRAFVKRPVSFLFSRSLRFIAHM